MPKRLIITFAPEFSESSFTVRIDVRVLIGLAVLLVGSPVLFVAGATWGSKALITDLLRQNASLRMENGSYREATTELVAQVSTLQAAADALGARAAVDPQAARAMDRLPFSITHRAMGGGSSVADVTSPLTTVASTADPAFGLLRDVLHMVERKLDRARPDVERREALAAATPSIWPVAGWLSSTFGSRADPFTGSRDFHAGLDISADYGQPVRATATGTVVSARHSGDFGNVVVLDHGFGIGTRYGHLSRFAVAEGQQIHKGDIVGYIGSTGRSTSPHVHYELLLNGRPANPLRLLGQ
jgi:murein DD-endopeptidase MepM/ murein hydrolase activator NlpD